MSAADPKQTLGEHVHSLKLIVSAVFLLVLQAACEQESPMVDWQLQEMFDSISETTDWDMSDDMLWGYFFTDGNKSDLERAAPLLEEMGYSVNSIYLADRVPADEPDIWVLHVEKIETHSVKSLNQRNLSLTNFAREHDLDSYDGMDVGPIAGGR